MPLKTINDYIETGFSPNSRPAYRTVLDQLQNGRLPFYHIKIGKQWFIDSEVLLEEKSLEDKADELIRRTTQ